MLFLSFAKSIACCLNTLKNSTTVNILIIITIQVIHDIILILFFQLQVVWKSCAINLHVTSFLIWQIYLIYIFQNSCLDKVELFSQTFVVFPKFIKAWIYRITSCNFTFQSKLFLGWLCYSSPFTSRFTWMSWQVLSSSPKVQV